MPRKPKAAAPAPERLTCSGCVHWKEQTTPGEDRWGLCRRYPPTIHIVDGESMEALPTPQADEDACGEFKQRLNG